MASKSAWNEPERREIVERGRLSATPPPRCTQALERFATREPTGAWPAHPLFGALSGSDWGVLVYRHMDPHLRQFGA